MRKRDVVMLGIGALCGLTLVGAGWALLAWADPFSQPDGWGVSEADVYTTAVGSYLRQQDMPQGTSVSIVAYGGDNCGGVVQFATPDDPASFYVVRADSGSPVPAGEVDSVAAGKTRAEAGSSCNWAKYESPMP